MEKHPGGLETTQRLLELAGSFKSVSEYPDINSKKFCILDMGAGDGHSVHLLRELGFHAIGIDLHADSESLQNTVISGDFLHCPFPDQSFDAILSECSFYVSGNPAGALQEARRLLKKGGYLLLADVSYHSPELHAQLLTSSGFQICAVEDLTALWKEYYISCIWNGTADLLCPRREKGPCYYYLTVCERM